MTTKKLAIMSMLTAIALIVFIIEAQIPLPLPIPGAKLGLANTVTLFALFFNTGKTHGKTRNKTTGKTRNKTTGETTSETIGETTGKTRGIDGLTTIDAFMILICRIILGAAFTGRIIAFIYSIAGGLFGFAAQAAMKRLVTNKQIWACGAIGAVFHNIGQILAAIILTGTPSIIAYLPLLTIAGIITGIITGLTAQYTIKRITH